ncbi:MAG: ABC transporter substrate-binding protein [Flammeovirgaceae bacterium]
MKKLSLAIVAALLILSGCNKTESESENTEKLTPANGGKFYGGVFRLNESEYIKNLFPHSIIDVYSYRVAAQVYEGLFKFDQRDLSPIPCLVASYEKDPTNTIYTFKLKQNVYFHDDECFSGGKGRLMTANDVKYCFTMLCTKSRTNQSFNLFDGILKGANEYYEATSDGKKPSFEVSGIKVIDNYTIQMELVKPNSMFLYQLARPGAFIFPKEAYEKYGQDMRVKCVGTGPYTLANVDEDISIILKKNANYHGVDEVGNKLPFIDAISIRFLKDKKVELLEFRKGNLDMMYRLPTDYIIEILSETTSNDDTGYGQYDLQRNAEMSTQILTFFNKGEVFDDVNVRKAFSYAIDREKILDYVLNGEGYMEGYHGITPPAFDYYDISKVKGYNFNPDSAKIYLKKAGFPDGKGFPKITLDLNTEGERYSNVALEVQKQLKENLNIDIELQIYPIAQITEKATSGDFNLLRLAWVADYPSPENYLWAFYSKNVPQSMSEKSYPNMARYTNPKFDELYEKALAAGTQEEAMNYFLQAEQLLMRDAPILILWYDEGYRLMQSYVKNFPNNAMQYRDFSSVYMIEKADSLKMTGGGGGEGTSNK